MHAVSCLRLSGTGEAGQRGQSRHGRASRQAGHASGISKA